MCLLFHSDVITRSASGLLLSRILIFALEMFLTMYFSSFFTCIISLLQLIGS